MSRENTIFATEFEESEKCTSIITEMFIGIRQDLIDNKNNIYDYFKFSNVKTNDIVSVGSSTKVFHLFKIVAETPDGIFDFQSGASLNCILKPFNKNKKFIEDRKLQLCDAVIKYTEDGVIDKEDTINKLIQAYNIDPHLLKELNEKNSIPLFYTEGGQIFSQDKSLSLSFLNFGLENNHISKKNYEFICEKFLLNKDYFRSPREQVIIEHFEQSFNLLKKNNHDSTNEFSSRADFKSYYVENDKVKVIVCSSDNSHYTVVQDKSNNRIRSYLSLSTLDEDDLEMYLEDFEEDDLIIDTLINELEEYSDIYTYSLVNKLHKNHIQLANDIIENYEDSSNLIYDSELGFSLYNKLFPLRSEQIIDSFYNDFTTINRNLCNTYKEKQIVVYSGELDHRSSTYIVRKLLTEYEILYKSRCSVLGHLFFSSGNGFSWVDGILQNGTHFLKSYEPHPMENNYEQIGYMFIESHSSIGIDRCPFMNAPDNINSDWKELMLEAFRYVEDIKNNHCNDDIFVKNPTLLDNINNIYSNAKQKLDGMK